jgi:uncharacterized protein
LLTQRDVVRILHDEYPHLAAEYGVKRIGLFGSYAHGAPTEASDVDLVVEFERPIGFRFVDLSEYLERVLGKRVDILTPGGIEGIRIQHIAEAIRGSVVYV